jgi:NADH-quinone oxidoreductase subunit C
LSSEADAPPAEADAPPAEAKAPVDEVRRGLVDTMRAALGEAVLDEHIAGGDAWVRVAASSWAAAASVAKHQLGMTYFCFLAGIDWKQADLTATQLWDPEAEPSADPGDGPGAWTTGVAGGETRFQVMCRLYNTVTHLGITLKADCGDEDPHIESLVALYRGADWHERETWEMYGVHFQGHPGLRHLYLPGEFEGYPLRKDFPLLAREVKPWPGLVNVEGLPGEVDGEGDGEGGSEGDGEP